MYKLVKNKEFKEYESTGGMKTFVPKACDYSIYFGTLHVLDIKDYFLDPKSIGNGLVEILNKERKIKLPLDI